ncbi:MAG: M24 family metallopeptidase [Paracoccaceae bacterium]
MFANPFSDDELAARLERVRTEMMARRLDIALISTPENIFYLTGLDHWGYFAPHLLVVPLDGEMTLIARAMERVTIEQQVRNALFEGHEDSETMADLTVRHLRVRRQARVRAEAALEETEQAIADVPGSHPSIGVETWSSGHSYAFGRALREEIDDAEWTDITGMIDALRLVKSPAEQALMRRAARVADAGAAAAIAAIRPGAAEVDVAAECLAAMTRAGGQPPGFGPFIRPGNRLGEEHTTWGEGAYPETGTVFLELAGCIARYNTPMGRLVHLGRPSAADARIAEIADEGFAAILEALRPGALARDVYAAWQSVVDEAGLAHYRRHHCGYAVGIGFPPSWTGGNNVTGIRQDSEMEIRVGMSFHAMSWLMGTGRGDCFVSNTVLLNENGAEVLTSATPETLIVR